MDFVTLFVSIAILLILGAIIYYGTDKVREYSASSLQSKKKDDETKKKDDDTNEIKKKRTGLNRILTTLLAGPQIP